MEEGQLEFVERQVEQRENSVQVFPVLVGIVTFNPVVKDLIRNISNIPKEHFDIVLVDNHSENIGEIVENIDGSITLIQNVENCGVAVALNQIMAYGKRNNYRWVLLLDHDSEYPFDQFSLITYSCEDEVGIVAPGVLDRNGGDYILTDARAGTHCVTKCITSGSLTSVSAWSAVGGFDEALFIDGVDFDFCKRLIKRGYKIIQNSDVVMLHELGRFKEKSILVFKFKYCWHSPLRTYYIVRNMVYMERKYREERLLYMVFRLIKRFLEIVCLLDQKHLRVRFFFKAIRDGMAMRISEP